MVDTSLVISIDRTGMPGDPEPLVFYGERGLGSMFITDYTEPAMAPRIRYATASDYEHGDEPRGWTWQQSILGWGLMPDDVGSEQAARLLAAELVEAVARLRYEVTVTVGGADDEVWPCNPGSVLPVGSRSYADLAHSIPRWSVSLPCYPVRNVA